jgi:hypothetical protein
MKNRIAWTEGDSLFVVRKGRTTNKKIAPEKSNVVQTYTFDLRQAAMVRSAHADTKRVDRKEFFRMDGANCLDCPLASLKGCYTHKYMQYSGFISMLRSLSTEAIYSREQTDLAPIKDWCASSALTRFGTRATPTKPARIGLTGTRISLWHPHTPKPKPSACPRGDTSSRCPTATMPTVSGVRQAKRWVTYPTVPSVACAVESKARAARIF